MSDYVSNHEFDTLTASNVYKLGRLSCQLSSDPSCIDYHFIRPVLRNLGLSMSPFAHSAFYTEALNTYTNSMEHPKILITGTADYSWALSDSPLFQALGDRLSEAQIELTDICPTPLTSSNYVFAKSAIVSDHSVQDFRHYVAKGAYSLIVSDAFLTQFSSSQDRITILRNWYRLLEVGAFVITTAQVKTNVGTVATAGLEQEFAEEGVRRFHLSTFPEYGLSARQLSEDLSKASRNVKSRVYESEQMLLEEISVAGLKIIYKDRLSVPPHFGDRVLSYAGLVLSRAS